MDVDGGRVTVAYDPAHLTPDDLCAALDGAGFPCESVSDVRDVSP